LEFSCGKLETPIRLEHNAEKEAKEESGLSVKVKGLVGIYQKTREERTVIIFVFTSKIIGGRMRTDYPDDEILQAKWFSEKELKKMKKTLRDDYILKAISDWKKKSTAKIGRV